MKKKAPKLTVAQKDAIVKAAVKLAGGHADCARNSTMCDFLGAANSYNYDGDKSVRLAVRFLKALKPAVA